MWYIQQHVLQIVFIRTYQGFYLWKDLWPKLSALCIILNLSYNCVYVMSRRCLIWSSESLDPLLNFSTYFWLEEDLVFSCQKSWTTPCWQPFCIFIFSLQAAYTRVLNPQYSLHFWTRENDTIIFRFHTPTFCFHFHDCKHENFELEVMLMALEWSFELLWVLLFMWS